MTKKKKSEDKALPRIKKDIKHFLTSEEGRVTGKQVAAASFLLAALASSAAHADDHGHHDNDWSYLHYSTTDGHVSHGSHSSHGSHASHGNW